MTDLFWRVVNEKIGESLGQPFSGKPMGNPGGGCINQTARFSDGNTTYFVKRNRRECLAMFRAEAAGLEAIADTRTIRVPKPVCHGVAENDAFLVLEWLELSRGNQESWREMGKRLAALHRYDVGGRFGWPMDNTIGATPQINGFIESWGPFFAERRLEFQWKSGVRRGGNFPKLRALISRVPDMLADHRVRPSLVHGDLWSGNAAFADQGEPVMFDVAVYFGDREVDLAMSELFGGFPADFYRAYNEEYPLPQGYERRRTLYNLYHVLNHFNLFGGHYEAQANRMIDILIQS